MQIEVEVWKNKESGFIYLSEPGSDDSKYNLEHKYRLLGTTMIEVKEPKKKKLVYQWLFETSDKNFRITNGYYSTSDRDIVIGRLGSLLKEGGILRPIMESEKEIDV